MSHDQPTPEEKDPSLWEIAKKRADLKEHLATYLIVNGFLWALWYFMGNRHDPDFSDSGDFDFPWPLWSTLGWGIGLAFHFAEAYIFPKANSVEKEYEKLKNRN